MLHGSKRFEVECCFGADAKSRLHGALDSLLGLSVQALLFREVAHYVLLIGVQMLALIFIVPIAFEVVQHVPLN